MRFQVPQFIEHEPKVVGPFTFKQFVYLAVPGSVAFFLYFTMPFNAFIVAAILLELAGFALGFLKSGGKSLPEVLLNFLGFTLSPKTYLWKGKKRGGAGIDTVETYQETQQEKQVSSQIKLIKK